jgi:ribosomal protein S18 acetylase RimI-like enzyme
MLAFRAATEADRRFCWDLHVATLRGYVERTWGQWDDDDQERRFHAWFEPAKLRVIEAWGVPIGFVKVDPAGDAARLLSIAIAPAHQRRGHGTQAMQAVIREAAPRAVWLQVLKVNPARALYERLGFELIGETVTHWQMLRPYRDAV